MTPPETTSIDKATLSADEIERGSHPLPQNVCGVYFLLKDKEIVYVGRSKNCMGRIATHTMSKDFDSYFICNATPDECDVLEPAYILKFQPMYNIMLPKTDLFVTAKWLKQMTGGLGKREIQKTIREAGYKPITLHHFVYYDRAVCDLFTFVESEISEVSDEI